MSSISKQAGLENESFYVLQTPCSGQSVYHIGGLVLGDGAAAGFFTSYDQSQRQMLSLPEESLDRTEFALYLQKGSSSAELAIKSNFEGKEDYRETFEAIKLRMDSRGFQKAVLFSTEWLGESGFPSKADFFSYILRLIQKSKPGYLFGFYNPKNRQAYLGLSPEFLCKESEGCKYTTAVAGTKSRFDKESIWTDKLLAEHDLVKRGINEKYNVEWSKTSIQDYGDLRHLKAMGLIKTTDSVQKVSGVLHPTSAVGTLPHEKSYTYKLGDLDHRQRGYFGGYACLDGDFEAFSLVTIRGVEWSNDLAFVCIGGGVLPESQFEDEWSELEKKWETFSALWQDE